MATWPFLSAAIVETSVAKMKLNPFVTSVKAVLMHLPTSQEDYVFSFQRAETSTMFAPGSSKRMMKFRLYRNPTKGSKLAVWSQFTRRSLSPTQNESSERRLMAHLFLWAFTPARCHHQTEAGRRPQKDP